MMMGHSLPQYTGNLVFQAFKWNSYVPKQFKTGLVNCLPNLAWKICSNSDLFHQKTNSSNQPWLLMDIPPIFLTVAQIDS